MDQHAHMCGCLTSRATSTSVILVQRRLSSRIWLHCLMKGPTLCTRPQPARLRRSSWQGALNMSLSMLSCKKLLLVTTRLVSAADAPTGPGLRGKANKQVEAGSGTCKQGSVRAAAGSRHPGPLAWSVLAGCRQGWLRCTAQGRQDSVSVRIDGHPCTCSAGARGFPEEHQWFLPDEDGQKGLTLERQPTAPSAGGKQ